MLRVTDESMAAVKGLMEQGKSIPKALKELGLQYPVGVVYRSLVAMFGEEEVKRLRMLVHGNTIQNAMAERVDQLAQRIERGEVKPDKSLLKSIRRLRNAIESAEG